jgi:hypothetical protein
VGGSKGGTTADESVPVLNGCVLRWIFGTRSWIIMSGVYENTRSSSYLSAINLAVMALKILVCCAIIHISIALIPQNPLRSRRDNHVHHISLVSSPSSQSTRLLMSADDITLLDQMKRALGETEDVFADVEKESRQLMQGTLTTYIDVNCTLTHILSTLHRTS